MYNTVHTDSEFEEPSLPQRPNVYSKWGEATRELNVFR